MKIALYRSGLGLLALAVLLGLYLLASRPAARLPPRPAEPGVLRLATANVFFMNPRVASTSARLAAVDADVLVVLEASAHNLRRRALTRAGWSVALDVHEGLKLGFGVTVFVRGSMTSEAALVPSPTPAVCQPGVAAVRLDVDGRKLALLGAHFAPPACAAISGSALDACATWIRDGRLVRDVGPCRAGDPAIVLGDFNTLPYFGGWGALERAGLVDAWSAARWLPGPTWALPLGVPSLARIDGILVPDRWRVLGAWTQDVPGSDHRVVVADVRLPDDG